MNKKILMIGILLLIAGVYVYASHGGFHFKFDPLISESEIVAFDATDAAYIDRNFDSLVVLEKIVDIQPPKECFTINKCSDEKRDVEEWCASLVYGIPQTSFTKIQPFCIEVPIGSRQSDVEIQLTKEGQRIFDSLKLVSPPVFLVDNNDPLLGDEYDYFTGQWTRK